MDTFYIVVLPMLLDGVRLETCERHTFPSIAQDRINIWQARSMVIVDPNQEPDPEPVDPDLEGNS